MFRNSPVWAIVLWPGQMLSPQTLAPWSPARRLVSTIPVVRWAWHRTFGTVRLANQKPIDPIVFLCWANDGRRPARLCGRSSMRQE